VRKAEKTAITGGGRAWVEPLCGGLPGGYIKDMRLMRTAAMAGIAKKLYDESKKPHNQKKIQDALASVKARRSGKGRPPGPSTSAR
jgi:hypothetical protein